MAIYDYIGYIPSLSATKARTSLKFSGVLFFRSVPFFTAALWRRWRGGLRKIPGAAVWAASGDRAMAPFSRGGAIELLWSELSKMDDVFAGSKKAWTM